MHGIAKIGIEEGRVVDAIAAANYGIPQPMATEQLLRGIGKTNARREVLVVGLGSGGIGTVNEGAKSSARTGIGGIEIEDGLNAVRFVARRIHVVAKAQVKGQILAKLEVILNEPDIVVLVPARSVQREAGAFLLRQAQYETGESVAGILVAGCKGSLEIAESIAGRGIEIVEPGKLRVAPLKAEAKRVAALDPGDRVRDDEAIGDGIIVVTAAESLVSDIEIIGLERDRGE